MRMMRELCKTVKTLWTIVLFTYCCLLKKHNTSLLRNNMLVRTKAVSPRHPWLVERCIALEAYAHGTRRQNKEPAKKKAKKNREDTLKIRQVVDAAAIINSNAPFFFEVFFFRR